MLSKIVTWILLMAAVPLLVSFGLSDVNPENDGLPPVQPRAPFDPKLVFDLTYMSRPDSALAIIEIQRRADPTNPFILLLKAKVLRERLNDEDNDKALIKKSTKPIHAVLDTAIALAIKHSTRRR